jgi:beta-glucosidase
MRFLLGIEPPKGVWRAEHAAHVTALQRRTPRVLFLGDSITAGWLRDGRTAWDRHFAPRGDIALGIGADDTARLLWRLRHGGLPATAPRAIVLHVGVNDLCLGLGLGPAAATRGIGRVVRHLRVTFPQMPVLLLGLIAPRPTPDVQWVNASLVRSADGRGVRYVDLNPVLTPARVPDNVHPNAAGYDALASILLARLCEVGIT